MSKDNGVVDVLYQELQGIRSQQARLAQQVDRLQRFADLDNKEFALVQRQNERMVMERIAELTEALESGLLAKTPEERTIEESERLNRQIHAARQRKIQQDLADIRRLSKFRQRVTPLCPCGQHKGIQFINEKGEIELEICPKVWWIKMSRLAFSEKRLKDFVNQTPLDRYLKYYNLIIDK